MTKKVNLRGVALFGVACFTSPCCTPLIVPLVLALLAGTPVALWLSQHIGWVYGGLTLISAVSLVLSLRWLGKRKSSQPAPIYPSNIPVIPTLVGDKIHVQESNAPNCNRDCLQSQRN